MGWLKLNGETERIVDLSSGATLMDLLREYFASNQAILKRVLKENSLSSSIIVLVNGIDAKLIQEALTKLTDGDQLTLIPVVHGG